MVIRVKELLLDLRELDDDFDVVGFSLQGLPEILRHFTARDQAVQPVPVQALQALTNISPASAAEILGVKPTTLEDQMAKLGIHSPEKVPTEERTVIRYSGGLAKTLAESS